MNAYNTIDGRTGELVGFPSDSLVRLTHLIYALHTASVIIGITTSATIVGAFIFGIPSIIAVILNYVKRGEVRGTYLESHFRWQIRTFWYTILWGLVALLLLALTIIGLLIFWLPIAVLGIWVIYRIVRGWLALKDAKPLGA